MLVSDLKTIIREVPDYPKPGVNFYDLTTLFKNGAAFRTVIERLAERFRGDKIDVVVGIEARGFMLAAALAYEYEVGIVPVRKPGKLPWRITGEDYTLEYGHGRLEVHEDAVERGQRVLIVDDVLATGGTAAATGKLVARLGAAVCGYAFLLELGFLGGRNRLSSDNVFSLITYP
jgi:adenine phosphoribosyltransferase